jgi:II/X family phage/plasmid replication protein
MTLSVDWITAILPCHHSSRLSSGKVLNVEPDGTVKWEVDKPLSVEGSYSSKIVLKTHSAMDLETGQPCSVWFSGNPAKFLQGHNLFGHSDPVFLTYHCFKKILSLVPELTPTAHELESIRLGYYQLNRIDLNAAFDLGSERSVGDWIHFAGVNGRTRHGRATTKKGTVYFGKTSRRWSLKFYHKPTELKAHPPERIIPQAMILDQTSKLRAELTLRHLELEKLGLKVAANWTNTVPTNVYNEYLSKLELTPTMNLNHSEILAKLPNKLAGTYELWRQGLDLTSRLSKATLYRHRKELLEYDVDIFSRPPEQQKSNVVPLIRILEAKPVNTVEKWKNTEFYFSPETKYLFK